jgi:hypothetical protein
MAQKEETRNYHESDGDLLTEAGVVSANVNRDIADFNNYGITDTTTLDDLTTAFDGIPTDDELLGEQEDATKNKNELADQVRVAIRSIRTKADLQYKGVGKYKSFGFKGMDELSDNDLCRMAGRVFRVGTTLLSDLAARGLTTAQLTALNTLRSNFNDAIEAEHEAIENRSLETEARVEAGNALWAEMVNLCSIGKTIYADTDPAKYKQYVLTHEETPPPPVKVG